MVKYKYDAWGNHAVLDGNGADLTGESHIGNLNPFRYRGYFYDVETELYYLQTRYYDPEVGRFITIDGVEYLDPETINGLNLYAYCGNNPVMRTDPDGSEWWEWLLGIGIIVAAIALTFVTAGIATSIATALGSGLVGSIVGGAVAGAIGGAITGFGMSFAIQGITNGFSNIDWKQVGFDTLFGAISGAVAGGIFGGIKFLLSSKTMASSIAKINQASSKFYDTLKSSIKLSSILKKGLPYLNASQKIYYVADLFVNGVYALGKFVFKDFLNNIFKGVN